MNDTDENQNETADEVAEIAARIANSEPLPEAVQEVPDEEIKTIPEVIDSPESAKEAHEAVGNMDISELKAELKSQILDELKDEQVKKMELEKERRERETAEQQAYIAKMKASPDPWVDVVGWVRDSQGVRTELEWNDAFVDYLRAEGVTGVEDDNVVHKWVALMMHDMAGRMDDEFADTNGSEFAG